MSVAETAFAWFIVEKGYLDDVELKQVVRFESALLDYLIDTHADLLQSINEHPVFDDDTMKKMKDVLTQFKSTQSWS